MDQDYYFPAEIQNREMPETVQVMLREMIKGDFGGQSPYFFRAEISSDRLDSHFTHMTDSTLHNFAAESEAGVSFLDSHKRWSLPVGYTLTGSYEDHNGISRVVSDMYTVPGIGLGSHSYSSTDDLIRAMKGSLVRKVSVGFHGGEMLCDICGYSFWDFRNCAHWPGRKYMVTNDDGVDIETVSTFSISDAHLAEVSAVYEGSTPGAMILRAEGMAEAGLLDGEEIRRLETQYRIRIPVGQRVWPVEKEIQANGVELMAEVGQQAEEMLIREILKTAGAPTGDLAKCVRWLADDRDRLKKANDELGPLAVQGKQYREDTIKDALMEGVRALGEHFNVEIYEKMFDRAGIGQIKQTRDDWKRQADIVFKKNRLTVDGEEQSTTPTPAPVDAVPDAAYRS